MFCHTLDRALICCLQGYVELGQGVSLGSGLLARYQHPWLLPTSFSNLVEAGPSRTNSDDDLADPRDKLTLTLKLEGLDSDWLVLFEGE